MNKFFSIGLFLSILAAGCAGGYAWRPAVPDGFRTVAVPVMRNESGVTEIGSVMTRQLCREFQREGTFALRPVDEAALEIQGVVKNVSDSLGGYSRKIGLRYASFDLKAEVEISVIDRRTGRVLVDNRLYRAAATFSTGGDDVATARRDASGRLAEDLARQVVGDLLDMKYEMKGNGEDEQ